MSKRLIYEEDAIDAFADWFNGTENTIIELTFSECRSVIESLPSAQPEIIRCKDCLMHGVCRFEQGLGLDGYCSQAERRQDGKTD